MNAIGQPSLELRYSAGQRRDSEVSQTAHDEHAHSLLSYVVGLTRDRASAQDTVQEELQRASRTKDVLERAGGSGRRRLWTMARRIVMDQWRSSSRRPGGTDRPRSRGNGGRSGATDGGPTARSGRTEDAVNRTPTNAIRDLLPRRICGPGRRGSRCATGHGQVPNPLRAPRATTGNRRDGRSRMTTPDLPGQHDADVLILGGVPTTSCFPLDTTVRSSHT